MILEKRVASLERRILPSKSEAVHVWDDATTWSLISKLAVTSYNDWRHQVLSLEERLALVRKDAAPKPEVWGDRWDSSVGCPTHQLLVPSVDMSAVVAAREFEIRILERDQRIDAPEAMVLRKNYHAHRHTKPLGSVALVDLPYRVSVDDGALSEALRKCPPRESLTLEEQLELAHGDNEDWYRRRCPAAANLDVLRDMTHREKVAEIRSAIRERDATRAEKKPHVE